MKTLYIIILACFISCKTEMANEKPLSQVSIDLSTANPINLELFCSQIELIPLETTKESLISSPGRIILYNNHFYIRDRVQHILFKFDVNGRFCLSSKNLKGEGPCKYLSLIDFDLLSDHKHHLALLDGPGYKIHFIDTGFNYQSFSRISEALLPIGNFTYKGDSTFIFHRFSKNDRNSTLSYLHYGSGDIVDFLLPKSNGHQLFASVGSHFTRFNENLYFDFKNGSNDIYMINQDDHGLSKYVNIDFGRFNIDPAKIEYGATHKESVERNANKFAALYNFQETDDYFVIHFLFDDIFNVSLVEKDSNKTETYIMKPGTKGQLPPPFMADNNTLFTISEAMYVKYYISEKLLSEDSQRLLQNIDQEDNHVIIKYTLK
jgi:hypothetical protein